MMRDGGGGGAEAIKDACQIIVDDLVSEEPLYPVKHDCLRVQVVFENLQAACCVSDFFTHPLKICFFHIFSLMHDLDTYPAQDEEGREAEMVIEFQPERQQLSDSHCT